jgi:ubiquinone/menaquinone biosynthesis C-methylase UbiE
MSNEVKDYYNQLANKYDEDRFANTYGKFINQQEEKYLKKQINGNKQVLNLGCGTGRFMEYCTHGSDIAENMIKIARTKYSNKDFSIASANDLPYEDCQFDTVICFHVLMHLDIKLCQSILMEAKRILKPGGKLIIDYPSKKRRRLFKYKAQNWHAATEFTPSEINKLFNSNNSTQHLKGVLSLPIHRLPKSIRKVVLPLDNFIGSSPLKQYSSYILHTITK